MKSKNTTQLPSHGHLRTAKALPRPLPRSVRERINAVANRNGVKPAEVEQELRDRLGENAERTRFEETARAAEIAEAQGTAPDEGVRAKSGIRGRRKVVAELRVKLDASDARIARMLRSAFGLPLAQLVRMLIRSEFAATYGKEALFPALEPAPEK
jgi:hypothetical protein